MRSFTPALVSALAMAAALMLPSSGCRYTAGGTLKYDHSEARAAAERAWGPNLEEMRFDCVRFLDDRECCRGLPNAIAHADVPGEGVAEVLQRLEPDQVVTFCATWLTRMRLDGPDGPVLRDVIREPKRPVRFVVVRRRPGEALPLEAVLVKACRHRDARKLALAGWRRPRAPRRP